MDRLFQWTSEFINFANSADRLGCELVTLNPWIWAKEAPRYYFALRKIANHIFY